MDTTSTTTSTIPSTSTSTSTSTTSTTHPNHDNFTAATSASTSTSTTASTSSATSASLDGGTAVAVQAATTTTTITSVSTIALDTSGQSHASVAASTSTQSSTITTLSASIGNATSASMETGISSTTIASASTTSATSSAMSSSSSSAATSTTISSIISATGSVNSTSTTISSQSSSHTTHTSTQPQAQIITVSSIPIPTSPVVPWKPRSVSMYKREKMTLIGEGTYGSVFLARTDSDEMVALKKIRKEKKEGFPITAIREIKILKALKHPNIVNLKDVVSSHDPSSSFEGNVFMVFEFCEHDLTGLLESQVHMTDAQIKYYMRSILQGLDYCHRNKILHRDIKGANILISNNGDVKIADFGLARIVAKWPYTNRVVTLWYRPPELLLGQCEYDSKIDMWSMGCLFAELLTRGRVLFPGNNTDMDQLNRIYDICGTPSEANWPGVSKLKYFQQFTPTPRPRQLAKYFEAFVASQHSQPAKDRVSLTRCALDLLDQLLTLDPAQRIDADAALNHDYFWKEEPAVMKPHEHPKYKGFFHEYSSKKKRRNRDAALAAGAPVTAQATTQAQATSTVSTTNGGPIPTSIPIHMHSQSGMPGSYDHNNHAHQQHQQPPNKRHKSGSSHAPYPSGSSSGSGPIPSIMSIPLPTAGMGASGYARGPGPGPGPDFRGGGQGYNMPSQAYPPDTRGYPAHALPPHAHPHAHPSHPAHPHSHSHSRGPPPPPPSAPSSYPHHSQHSRPR